METKGKILIVDDNQDVLFALNLLLEPYTEKVKVTTQPERIIHFMDTFKPDVILLDMNFCSDAVGGQEGFDHLRVILEHDPKAVVVFMTAYSDTDKAVRAIKAGATDFVSKPWENEKMLATISSAVELSRSRKEVDRLKHQVQSLNASDTMPQLIGESAQMLQLKDMICRLGATDANILILGENGTGKDLVARSLKHLSPRASAPFVTIDLGTIPEQLFESELFGYEKGAFTDARTSKPGRMEMASGGTLFLDEVGNLTPAMQAKLLTAIEKRQTMRLGAVNPTDIDVRLISATNAPLAQMAADGRFRQDLLYRINTIELRIPPLRERGTDILLLASHFLDIYSHKYHKQAASINREAQSKLMRYPWPGNVRELQHVVERAVILSDGRSLRPDDFFLPESGKSRRSNDTASQDDGELNLERIERRAIERALRESGGNMTYAAEKLGITRFALYRKIEKYKL